MMHNLLGHIVNPMVVILSMVVEWSLLYFLKRNRWAVLAENVVSLLACCL